MALASPFVNRRNGLLRFRDRNDTVRMGAGGQAANFAARHYIDDRYVVRSAVGNVGEPPVLREGDMGRGVAQLYAGHLAGGC